MELWDIYTKDRVKSGKTMVRGSEFDHDAYHLVVTACIFNKNNEMLVQQRQSFKSGWPNMWDITSAGSALSGENSQTAIEREIFEELGLKIDLKNIRPHMTINFDVGFDDIYLIEKEIDINKLKLQYEEVQNVKWASIDEIYRMIDEELFVPYYKSLIQFFFDARKNYGCHFAK